MAKLVLRDCFIEVNGVNFSSHVSSVTINLSKDEIDTTNFGGDGRERAHGLKDDSFELTFQQDYAVGEVDDTLYPLWDDETEFIVKVRPRSSAISTSNPEYSATCILLEYTPLAGDVGDLSTTDVTFPAQRAGIARATA
jgi:UTP:GlnB (protein PII) uridylyltransferase